MTIWRRRARRPAAPGRVPRAHGRGSRPVRLRRRGPDDRRQDGAPPPARLRHRADRQRRGANRCVGGPERSRAPRGGRRCGPCAQRARRRGGRLPCPDQGAGSHQTPAPRGSRSASTGLRRSRFRRRSTRKSPSCAPRSKPAPPPGRVADELGDLLFAVGNLARRLDHRPGTGFGAERCRKFERRFRAIEAALVGRGTSPGSVSLDEMEAEWQRAKAAEA